MRRAHRILRGGGGRGRLAAILIGPAIALSLLLPFVLRQNAWFEWSNALWLVERQADAIRDLGHPTYFLHTPETGVFYPQFAFYGGALFAVTGALALAVGSAWWAFVAILVLAALCAYGSVLWIGRQAGLGLGSSTLAALAIATSPYTVATLYGRGAWTETVATAAVPLALAGALATMRGRRPWAGVAALAGAAAIVGASHNITVVWGSIVCIALGLVVLWAMGATEVGRLPGRRAVAGLGALVLGGALAAWSLVPSVVYGRTTRAYTETEIFIDRLESLDRLDVILRPYPFAPSAVEGLNPAARFQLPVYVLAWALAAFGAAVVARRASRTDRRLAAGLWAVLVCLVVLLVANRVWRHMPEVLLTIQQPLRLHAYAVIVAALVVVVTLRMLRGAPRRRVWVAALVAALAVQTGLAQYSAWDAPGRVRADEIQAGVLPPAYEHYQRVMYRSMEGRAVPRPGPSIAVNSGAVNGDRARVRGPEGGAPAFRTNVVDSALVRVDAPWRIAGHDALGLLVLERLAGEGSGDLVIERAWPWPVALATILSLVAAGVVLLGGGLLLGRRLRRRTGPPLGPALDR